MPFIDQLIEIFNFASTAWSRFPSLQALETGKGVTGRNEREQVPDLRHEVPQEMTGMLQEHSVHIETLCITWSIYSSETELVLHKQPSCIFISVGRGHIMKSGGFCIR